MNIVLFERVMEVYCDGELVGRADGKVKIGDEWYPCTVSGDVIHDNGEALPLGSYGVEVR